MKTVFLVLTASVMIAGELCQAGDLVEVSRSEAKDLLGRERARLATENDAQDGQEGPSGEEMAAANAEAADEGEKAATGHKPAGRIAKAAKPATVK